MDWADTRGSSITVEYVLTLLVALSLLGGVSAAVGPIDDRQEERIVEDQLTVAGNEIAVQLEHQYLSLRQTRRAERLAAEAGYSGGPFTFESVSRVETPERVASGTYTVQVSETDSIVLTPSVGAPTIEVPLRPEIPVRESSGAPGDEILIVYNDTDSEFVLRSGGAGAV